MELVSLLRHIVLVCYAASLQRDLDNVALVPKGSGVHEALTMFRLCLSCMFLVSSNRVLDGFEFLRCWGIHDGGHY